MNQETTITNIDMNQKTEELETVKSRDSKRANVRFTDQEYEKLEKDVKNYGETIPVLLRKKYFSKPLPDPTVTSDEAKALLVAINRAGNNLNQIAREVNSGYREGFIPELEKLVDLFSSIRNFLAGKNGNR